MKKIILDFLIIQNLFLSLSKINVMEGSEWTGIAAAGLNTLATVGNAYMTANASHKDRLFAKEMYQLQREDALSDWNRQNEYNAPSSVMQRLAQAGLNPNLAVASPTAADMPRSSSVTGYSSRTPQFNMDFAALASLASQIKVNQSLANKNNAEAEKAISQTEGQDLLNELQVMQNETYKFTQEALKEQPYLENQLTAVNIQNITASTSLLKAKFNLTEAQTKMVNEQLLEIQAKVKLLATQTKLTEQQIITEVFKGENLKADSQLKLAMASVQPALAQMYESVAALNAENTSFLQDTHLVRYGQEVNKLSKLAEEVQNISEDTKLTQYEQYQKEVDTGSRILNGILQVGDIALDILSYRSARAASVRGRHSRTTISDSKGKVVRTIEQTSH